MADKLNIRSQHALFVLLSGVMLGSQIHAQDYADALEAADAVQAKILAPDLYQKASRKAADVDKYAANKPERAAEADLEATNLFRQAAQVAELRGTRLEQALGMRARAFDAGASNEGNKLWEQAEKYFAKAVESLARDKDEVAQRNADFALQYYDAAELEALQNRVSLAARERLKTADQLRAQRFAPITLQLGRDFVASSRSILQKDRTLLEQAQELGDQAEAFADRAIQITQLAKEKPTLEEVILMWETRLETLQRASGQPAPSTLDPDIRVANLADTIDGIRQQQDELNQQLNDSQQFIAALEDEIRDLDTKLGGASAERRDLVIRLESQARATEQLNQAKSIFAADEARIFTQSGKIVVRLAGLRFASGSSTLTSSSESLLEKLSQLIGIYPQSTLVVEGHTDSQGGETTNLNLSQARADAVLNRLVGEYRVPATRITAIGYGESQPIANNETNAGRIRNRRIDLVITPASLPSGL